MKNIALNLAGDFVIIGYTPTFRKVCIWDTAWKCWHPITARKPLMLRCGLYLNGKDVAKAIQHKLGLI